MCKAPKRGWSHVLNGHVCIRGKKGDDDALSSLGLDGDAILRCHKVDVPPIGPSPPDEVLLYWSVDQYNNVQKL